jgi:hypothetical protein
MSLSAVILHPAQVRLAETTSPEFQASYGLWKVLTYFSVVSFLLWTLALRDGAFDGKLAVLAPIGVLSIVEFFFTGDRTLLGTTLIWVSFFHLLWRPIRQPARALAKIALAFVLCLVVFLGLGARLGKNVSAFPEMRGSLTMERFEQVAPAYAYITSSPPTLSKLMADPSTPHTEGALTMLPFVKIAHRVDLAGVPPDEIGGFYSVPFAMNLYSWLGSFYVDYGLLGTLVGPALVGLLGATLAGRVGRHRSMNGAWLLALLLFVLVASPFGNKLSSALTWELAAIGLFASLLEVRRRPNALSVMKKARTTPNRVTFAITGIGIVILTSLVVAIAATRAASVDVRSVNDARDALSAAGLRAQRTYPEGNYPASTQLASQLHFADSKLVYVGASPGEVPRQIGLVYVASRGGLLMLTMRLLDGILVAGRWYRTPQSEQLTVLHPIRNLLANPSFRLGVSGWRIHSSEGAHVELVRPENFGSTTALRVTGTGRVTPRPAFVVQEIEDLPKTDAGVQYELRIALRTTGAPRALLPEVKLVYVDGSYEFFTITPRALTSLRNGWRRARVRAMASKPLTGIEVFAVDTGVRERFRGSEWLSKAQLSLIQ